jgi:hypothetical protein
MKDEIRKQMKFEIKKKKVKNIEYQNENGLGGLGF